MAYYDHITMIRLQLGKWAAETPVSRGGPGETAEYRARQEARQDGPDQEVESRKTGD